MDSFWSAWPLTIQHNCLLANNEKSDGFTLCRNCVTVHFSFLFRETNQAMFLLSTLIWWVVPSRLSGIMYLQMSQTKETTWSSVQYSLASSTLWLLGLPFSELDPWGSLSEFCFQVLCNRCHVRFVNPRISWKCHGYDMICIFAIYASLATVLYFQHNISEVIMTRYSNSKETYYGNNLFKENKNLRSRVCGLQRILLWQENRAVFI